MLPGFSIYPRTSNIVDDFRRPLGVGISNDEDKRPPLRRTALGTLLGISVGVAIGSAVNSDAGESWIGVTEEMLIGGIVGSSAGAPFSASFSNRRRGSLFLALAATALTSVRCGYDRGAQTLFHPDRSAICARRSQHPPNSFNGSGISCPDPLALCMAVMWWFYSITHAAAPGLDLLPAGSNEPTAKSVSI